MSEPMSAPDPEITASPTRYHTVECPLSGRVDGPLHSWRFDGDDPYVECVYCGEYRDARTGWVIRHGER